MPLVNLSQESSARTVLLIVLWTVRVPVRVPVLDLVGYQRQAGREVGGECPRAYPGMP